jgi:hypothetical protein
LPLARFFQDYDLGLVIISNYFTFKIFILKFLVCQFGFSIISTYQIFDFIGTVSILDLTLSQNLSISSVSSFYSQFKLLFCFFLLPSSQEMLAKNDTTGLFWFGYECPLKKFMFEVLVPNVAGLKDGSLTGDWIIRALISSTD